MNAADTDALAVRLAGVHERIRTACATAGRDPGEVRLVAVTKTHAPEACRALVDAGVLDLGENRVQELLAKIQAVGEGPRWHLIGPLQRNKVRAVVGRVVLIHSLDRPELATAIGRRAHEAGGAPQRALVEVNVSGDPRRAGCPPEALLDLLRHASRVEGLEVVGLTVIAPLPPPGTDPNDGARPHFASVREMRDAARAEWPRVTELSMGMSADLEAAVAEGATIVRVGTSLLGERGPGPYRVGEEVG